jgi:succinyldiaminopimelate transaminase
VQAALRAAADASGYPQTAGTPELRYAAVSWLERRFGLTDLDPAGVLPAIGSKEFIAWLPTLLNLGPGDAVEYPSLAYPTYDVGARLAGATPVVASATAEPARLLWRNSPANPHGAIASARELSDTVRRARETGAVLAVDECYIEFGWDARPVSVLDAEVNDGSLDGILAVHSLSKRSNMAGYRAGFVVGDPRLISHLLEWRRHAGFNVPAPIQQAMVAALDDDDHVDLQRGIYQRRREALRPALEAAGFSIEHSEGGLYLWATRGEDCWASVDWLAARGIVVAPGSFYGTAGTKHVRVALTVTDERAAAAVDRLS